MELENMILRKSDIKKLLRDRELIKGNIKVKLHNEIDVEYRGAFDIEDVWEIRLKQRR